MLGAIPKSGREPRKVNNKGQMMGARKLKPHQNLVLMLESAREVIGSRRGDDQIPAEK